MSLQPLCTKLYKLKPELKPESQMQPPYGSSNGPEVHANDVCKGLHGASLLSCRAESLITNEGVWDSFSRGEVLALSRQLLQTLLGGSWVVISGVISYK